MVFETINSTAVRLIWRGSFHLYVCIEFTVYYSVTRNVVRRYERVIPPGVTTTIIVFHIIPEVYEYHFSLYFNFGFSWRLPIPRTEVTFSFGEYEGNFKCDSFKMLLFRHTTLSDSVWTILPLSGPWGKSPLLLAVLFYSIRQLLISSKSSFRLT